MLKRFQIDTENHAEMVNVTDSVQAFIDDKGVDNGIAIVQSLHTTAGITINENADPDVKTDMIRRFDEIYPWDHQKDLHAEGNTASHMKVSTVGHAQTIIIENGQLLLGTWQGIYFCEYDGPRRNRKYAVKLMEG